MSKEAKYPLIERITPILMIVLIIVGSVGFVLAIRASVQIQMGNSSLNSILVGGLLIIGASTLKIILAQLREGWHHLYCYRLVAGRLIVEAPLGNHLVAEIDLRHVKTVIVERTDGMPDLILSEVRAAVPKLNEVLLISEQDRVSIKISPCLSCWTDILVACKDADWHYAA